MFLKVCVRHDGRKVRHFINAGLKSGQITQIKRINYVKSYEIRDKQIIKNEEKLLVIFFEEENKDKVLALLDKMFDNYTVI